jgi:O-acetyl-ADP-ribose deacetylase (regulator of RNase III)
MLLFSFFPESQVSGTLAQGITVGGAFGAFVLLWWYGTRRAHAAHDADDLRHELDQMKERLRVAPPEQPPRALETTTIYQYEIRRATKRRVGLVTGNLLGINFIDIWVNSENTHMQMARFFENSVSGTIRYHGAKRDAGGNVTEDVIGDELKHALGSTLTVQPATVLETSPGELAGSNNVKRLLHVAAVHGQPGMGYRQVDNVGTCVRNVLRRVDENAGGVAATSIALPLLGTGVGRGDPESTARQQLSAVIDYLVSSPLSKIEAVYFLCYFDRDLITCRDVFDHSQRIRSVKGGPVAAFS